MTFENLCLQFAAFKSWFTYYATYSPQGQLAVLIAKIVLDNRVQAKTYSCLWDAPDKSRRKPTIKRKESFLQFGICVYQWHVRKMLDEK